MKFIKSKSVRIATSEEFKKLLTFYIEYLKADEATSRFQTEISHDDEIDYYIEAKEDSLAIRYDISVDSGNIVFFELTMVHLEDMNSIDTSKIKKEKFLIHNMLRFQMCDDGTLVCVNGGEIFEVHKDIKDYIKSYSTDMELIKCCSKEQQQRNKKDMAMLKFLYQTKK